MNYRIAMIIICTLFSLCLSAQVEYTTPASRNPLKWPFSSTSIWNTPIGSDAVYVHAYIEKSTGAGMTIDEDLIILRPHEPFMDVYYSDAAWNRNKDRCVPTGGRMVSLPIPGDFVVSRETWIANTPNSAMSVLMPDMRTIKQNQPFAYCEEGGVATTGFLFDDVDLYGDGYYGAHGGSKLSAIGGTLRVGELTKESGPIRHALKINLNAANNLYYDEETKGFRWPALRADAVAATDYYKDRKNPVVPACRMGALLALPSWMDLDLMEFETEPARILAQAFQDYGAYVVDNTNWDVYSIIVEWGLDGRFSEEFEKNWGFSINPPLKSNPWSRDMDRIFMNLHVVDNNSPTSIGGGGTPRAPLAPDHFDDITGIKELSQHTLNVYPTVARDMITVEGIGRNETIKIYNSLGMMVDTTSSLHDKQTIDIATFTSGLYFLTTHKESIRFIKE
ncbi:MAG: T9SS type A sorting domain-containing protein [Candidatus Azobacteroides sp.]|nr:T9SS type A sorting domain-containing protein [Candidatus Azobacteroides sp.]